MQIVSLYTAKEYNKMHCIIKYILIFFGLDRFLHTVKLEYWSDICNYDADITRHILSSTKKGKPTNICSCLPVGFYQLHGIKNETNIPSNFPKSQTNNLKNLL